MRQIVCDRYYADIEAANVIVQGGFSCCWLILFALVFARVPSRFAAHNVFSYFFCTIEKCIFMKLPCFTRR